MPRFVHPSMAVADISGCDGDTGAPAQRGWSIRHGRRRRLIAPSGPQGPEDIICRGRSVFKRSANRGVRRDWWRAPQRVFAKPSRSAFWEEFAGASLASGFGGRACRDALAEFAEDEGDWTEQWVEEDVADVLAWGASDEEESVGAFAWID